MPSSSTTNSRPSSRLRPASSSSMRGSIPSKISPSNATASGSNAFLSDDLAARESQYLHMNAQMEAHAAQVALEADALVREQEAILSRSYNRGGSALSDDDGDDDYAIDMKGGSDADDTVHFDIPQESTELVSKSSLSVANGTRVRTIRSGGMKQPQQQQKQRPKSGRNKSAAMNGQHHSDLPIEGMSEDMGSEATLRFFKAKLRVMQSDIDKLVGENKSATDRCNGLEKKLSTAIEERDAAQRALQSSQTQLQRSIKTSDDGKRRINALETQIKQLQRDNDRLEIAAKKHGSASTSNNGELRLNRALEDVEKYKAIASKVQAQSKEQISVSRQHAERLLVENKRIDKQKGELIAAFKKQLKLIDVLKRQKIHIEAAKMLSFTEEEFVKALDWN